MIISLFGLTVFSGNKGCEALAYSFLDLLSDIATRKQTKFKIYIHIWFSKYCELPHLKKQWEGLDINIFRLGLKNRKDRELLYKNLNETDFAFDFTEGDSFSDIYGLKRFVIQSIIKSIVIKKKIKFILGPQTYGPFYSKIVKLWAKWIMNNSYRIYSRDEISIPKLKNVTKQTVIPVTDIAMALKTDGKVIQKNNNVLYVGINISGLLYNGGYTEDNQFNLTVDYKEYIDAILQYFCSRDEFQVFLIPHVITEDDYENVENDLKICNLVKQKYSNVQIIDDNFAPFYLKKIISQMDLFLGARMHATIAAFSTKVPVIPFAYSKKFEELYHSLNYDYVVDGRNLNTEEAINKTVDYIKRMDELKKTVSRSCDDALNKIDVFCKELSVILCGDDNENI